MLTVVRSTRVCELHVPRGTGVAPRAVAVTRTVAGKPVSWTPPFTAFGVVPAQVPAEMVGVAACNHATPAVRTYSSRWRQSRRRHRRRQSRRRRHRRRRRPRRRCRPRRPVRIAGNALRPRQPALALLVPGHARSVFRQSFAASTSRSAPPFFFAQRRACRWPTSSPRQPSHRCHHDAQSAQDQRPAQHPRAPRHRPPQVVSRPQSRANLRRFLGVGAHSSKWAPTTTRSGRCCRRRRS